MSTLTGGGHQLGRVDWDAFSGCGRVADHSIATNQTSAIVCVRKVKKVGIEVEESDDDNEDMDVDVREGSGGSGSNHHQGASSTQQLVTPPPIVATAGNLNNAPSHPQGNNPLQDAPKTSATLHPSENSTDAQNPTKLLGFVHRTLQGAKKALPSGVAFGTAVPLLQPNNLQQKGKSPADAEIDLTASPAPSPSPQIVGKRRQSTGGKAGSSWGTAHGGTQPPANTQPDSEVIYIDDAEVIDLSITPLPKKSKY